MFFLSPWFLPALAAAMVPVVLHLLNRRKRRVVRWAAMRFLMATEAQQRKSSLRLKDILLLLLRMAAVAALVLFFAGPLLPAGLAPAGARDVVLVLDTSLSMAQLTDAGPVWGESAARAEKALESLEAGDFVRILLAREAPEWLTASALEMTPGGKSQAAALLKSVTPGQGGCRLTEALAEAVAARPAREGLARRVVVFSDFQAESVKADAAAAWAGLRDAAAALPGGCVMEAVASGPLSTPPNLAVLRVEVSREQATAGEPLLFSARVRNAGPASSGVASLRWIVGSVPSGLSTVTPLKTGAETTVEFTHAAPPEPGTALVTCELETPAEDVLAGDNAASVLVETVEPPGVLLVDGSGAADAGVTDVAWIQAALGSVENEASTEPKPFRLTTVPVARFRAETIGSHRMIILANPPLLDAGVLTALENFVRNGGGLWLLPGDRTEDAGQPFSVAFFRKGAGLSPLRWMMTEGAGAADAEQAVKLRLPAAAHPVTRFLQDPRGSDFNSVRVRRWFRFESPAPPETQVLMTTEAGAPFLAERSFGQGRVLVQAAPFNLAWSDWPRHHAFVVLLYEGLWRLASPGVVSRNLAAGETLSWPVPSWITEDPLPLRKPDGQYGAARRSGQGLVAVSADTLEPGLYAVEAKGAAPEGTRFWVRRGEAESDLRPAPAEERERIQTAGGLEFTAEPLRRSQVMETVESRRPAGPLLAGAGVLLLCLESLVAARLLWRRHQQAGTGKGAAGAAETSAAGGAL
ncbi:MAG: BatA domain-containing protein [Verrucomicrobiota bacterium]